MGLTEKHLNEGARIKYIGKTYSFIPQEEEVTFLGFDSNSWRHIWIAYREHKLYLLIGEVDLLIA